MKRLRVKLSYWTNCVRPGTVLLGLFKTNQLCVHMPTDDVSASAQKKIAALYYRAMQTFVFATLIARKTITKKKKNVPNWYNTQVL